MKSSSSRFSTPQGSQLHSSYPADDPDDDDWDPWTTSANHVQPSGPAVYKNVSALSYTHQAPVSNTTKTPTSAKYPAFNENKLRKQCQDLIQQKSPMILIQRLLTDGFMPWEELSLLEKRLVDYNPRFFKLTIDLPDCNDRRVKLLRKPYVEQLDATGVKGGLRAALDEDLSWLPDVALAFSLDAGPSVRECAIISFVPPRCFVMCDKEAAENEERTFSISDGLRAFYAKNTAGEVEVRPGVALVGFRNDTFMRVVVLEPDVRKPIKVRCACMDHSAIFSFERSDLFPLPDEFSPKNVPMSIFLGRFRGTHYVYKEKYQEVNDAMCQPNKDEGYVNAVTCAIYGPAPDGLIIVDAAMPDKNWVSTVMVRSSIAAPMAGDPPVLLTAAHAEEMIKGQKARKARPSLEEQAPPRVECKYGKVMTENCAESMEEMAASVKSECVLPTIKEDERVDELCTKEQWSSKGGICSQDDSSDAEVKSVAEEALSDGRKQEEDRKIVIEKEIELNLLTATTDSSEKSERQVQHNSLWYPDAEAARAHSKSRERFSSAVSTYGEVSEQETKEDRRSLDEPTSSRIVEGSENDRSSVDNVASIKNGQVGQHPAPLLRPIVLHDIDETEEIENDVGVENLRRAFDAYIASRNHCRALPLLTSAMDFSVVSFLKTASYVLTADDLSAEAENLSAAAKMARANYLDNKEKV